MEFALLLPVLTLILLGIMVFGVLFNSYLGITHAAREGVRWAALRATSSEVQTQAQASAPGIDWGRATLEVIGVPASGASDADQGNPVTVRITYLLPDSVLEVGETMNVVGGIFGAGMVFPSEITSQATQRVE